WRQSVPLRKALLVTATTRPVVLFVAYLAVFTFGFAPGARLFNYFSNELFRLPLRWDAGWYLHIATDGYEYVPRATPDYQQNIVFFPAYPMTVRVAALFLGNALGSYVLAGVVVSLTFFAVALAYFYRIARLYLDDERAMTALWLIAAYPFAIFFG